MPSSPTVSPADEQAEDTSAIMTNANNKDRIVFEFLCGYGNRTDLPN
jgi:hypothetical protein